MAIFRKVHTSFWSDSFISDLDKDKKLFYIYLLTNDKTTQCGIYEITKKQISFDLGYSIDTVCKLLEYFIKLGKIKYNEDTKELAIGNWLKYNASTSPKVESCINKEFARVKDTVLIQYVKSIDTRSQEEEEEEEEQYKEEEQDLKKCAATWKNDFEIYLKDLREAWKQVVTPEYIQEREKYHSKLDIKLSLEKACRDYWSTIEGWKHKKKSKSNTINWVNTFNNALTLKSNQVYKSQSTIQKSVDEMVEEAKKLINDKLS